MIWREFRVRAARRSAICLVLAAGVLLLPPGWVEAAHWWMRVAWASL